MGALSRFELDRASRTNTDGTVLLGGSPLSMFRLTPAGKRLIERIRAGGELPPGHEPLTKRLVAAGAIHPVYDHSDTADTDASAAEVTLVIPAFNADPNRLAELVRRSGCGRAIVVDDASPQLLPPIEGAEVLRLSTNGGPGVARQHGLDLVSTRFVAFIDSDVMATEGWVQGLLPCFADEGVALAAPRIRAATPSSGSGWIARSLARFEAVRGPLDLGPFRGRIRSTTRVSYVPSAGLVCRVDALRQVGGFDPALRLGEDVDLVWRLDEAGWSCRYEPTTELWHDVRPSLVGWVRQRAGYGFSATDLALRHPGSVAPVQSSAWSAAAWALVASGFPITGCALAAGSTAALARKLPETSDRALLALRLAGLGHLHAGRTFAIALTRSWWPVTLAAALVSRRARRVAVAAALIPSLLDWWAVRRTIDPARYVGLRIVDDGAYGFGLWRGALARRSAAALRPRLNGWPRRRGAGGTPPGEQGGMPPTRG